MKFFTINPEIDNHINFLMRQIRHLMDGEASELMMKSGADYRRNYGVSLVHLRKMGSEIDQNNELARRLWYREIRETMILATLAANIKQLTIVELNQWGGMINTIELSEQMGRNILCSPEITDDFLSDWLQSEGFYKAYAAAMGIGWRFRLHPEQGFESFSSVLPLLKKLSGQSRFLRATAFALRMAGRFSVIYRPLVLSVVDEWKQDENSSVRQVADDVGYELSLLS